MASGCETLSDKEKDALRLLLQGHDAKSSARTLGLSVHTVNERLREARRKLGVTSSREAARRLAAEERGGTPKPLGDKPLGDAVEGQPAAGMAASASRRKAGFGFGPRPAVILVGAAIMSLILAALFLPASPLAIAAPGTATIAASTAAAAADSEAEGAARAAENFLVLIDQSKWAESYDATGAQFRSLNTLAVWSDVSARVRTPLGKLVTRSIVTNEFVPTPPHGTRLVKFASTYADGTNQIESVSLAFEDGGWRVVGIVIG